MMPHMFNQGIYSGDYNSMPEYMQQMMQGYYSGARPFFALAGLMQFITWLAFIALLISLTRYLWKKAK